MKELTSKSRAIAKAIVFAQLASDGGKGINDLVNEVNGKDACKCFSLGYKAKDGNIFKAIDLINRQKSEEVRFYVRHAWDQNGYASYLVYFTFRLNGKRLQVSFHSPDRGWSYLDKYCENTSATYWDKDSSRRTCLILAERFGWA